MSDGKVKIGTSVYSRYDGSIFVVTDMRRTHEGVFYQIDNGSWYSAVEMGDIFDLSYDELELT